METSGRMSTPGAVAGARQPAQSPASASGAVPVVSAPCRAHPSEEALLAQLQLDAPASLGALLLDRVAATPHDRAYQWPDGTGGWRVQTWEQAGLAATEIAAGLLDLGLGPEEPVAIMSTTRMEWIEADLGVMCAGGATTTVYPTSAADEVLHVLTDSGSRIAVVEHAGHLAKVLAPGSPVRHAVLVEGEPPRGDARVVTLADLRAGGRRRLAAEPELVAAATAAVLPDQLATLIYTSGATGRPKGVRLTHRGWVYQALTTRATGLIRPEDLAYLWLPLAHAFGKTLLATQLAVGHAAVVDGDITRIVDNLPVVRPTVMPAVPRIFEKVHAGVTAQVQRGSGLRRALFTWAVGVGLEACERRRAGSDPGWWLAARHRVADRLVFAKVRARFGGRIRYFISGAAALAPELALWFDALGLPILEGYGLTESSAATVVNRLDHLEHGTVGLPMPGTEVALAADGEILLRGPGLMVGYHHLPEETAEALVDGWLHTGDIGVVTERGSLRITDRKKDLIKTSGGKYVAPQAIEARFKAICPLAGQIVVHGENRAYITALITLDPDAAGAWAAEHGLAGAGLAEIAGSPQLIRTIAGYVDELNAGLGRWESIKRFTVLEREFTVEDGDLTPSLKLKRRTVERRHAQHLDRLYPA